MEDKPAESGMLRTPVEKSWINYLLNLLTGAGFLSINIVAASISSIRWTHALLRYLEFKVNEAYGACCLGTQVQAHHSLFQNILGHEFQRRYKFDRPLAPIGTKESKKKTRATNLEHSMVSGCFHRPEIASPHPKICRKDMLAKCPHLDESPSS